jgi:DNA-binding CsgD family transcriptional regulator
VARRVSSPSFVGRGADLAALSTALARSAAGVPAVVLVAGESGVGKSRLLAEFAAGARDGGVLVLEGECIELGDGELPYAPVVGALRHLVRVLEPGTLDDLSPASRRELARLVPELAPADTPPGAPSQPVLFEAVLALLARLAGDEPVLVVLEDMHWADRSTRDLLAFLARNLRDERVMVVASYRSDALHRRHPLRPLLADLDRLPNAERVELERLSRAEVQEQLAGILERAPDPDLVTRVHERSEGNPFFAEELVAAGADGPLPDSLRDALLLRTDALSEQAQEILRILAAAGRPVPGALLAAAAGTPDADLSPALREAVGHSVISVTEGDGDFRFRHALFGEAVYDDLLPGDRARLHRELARALAGDPALAGASESIAAAELAHHWHAAHELPAALAAWVRAGAASMSAGALAEAARHFGVALELWDQVPDAEARTGTTHAGLLQRAGEAAHLAGDHDHGAALLTRAAEGFEAAGDITPAALARTQLGRALWAAGRTEEAIAAHTRAVELMPATPTVERAGVLALQARTLMLRDRAAESRPVAEEALAIARSAGVRQAEGHALNTLGVDIAFLGDRERGIEHVRAALAIATDEGVAEDIGSAYVNLSDLIDQAGRLEEAAELGLEGMAACQAAGIGRMYGGFLASEVALRLIRLGRYDRAERLISEALATEPTGITGVTLGHSRAQLLLERGDLDGAGSELDRVREMTERTDDLQWVAPFAATEMELALWRGDADAAGAIGERVLARFDEAVFLASIAPVHAHALRAEADRWAWARARSEQPAHPGRSERLRAGLDRLVALDPGPELRAWAALARAEAERAGDRREEAAVAFGETAELFGALAMPFRTAYARLREVEVALAAGSRAREVADRLAEAHRLATGIAAPLLLAEIEGLARRGRVSVAPAGDADEGDAADAPPGDPLGLTARELEVLALVAEGQTNRQIGERLYMSDKTASVHVSRILNKLSVRNRGEAAAIAHRLGLTGR